MCISWRIQPFSFFSCFMRKRDLFLNEFFPFLDSGDRTVGPMLFPGNSPAMPSHIPIQMAAAPAQGYASSIVSTGPFPTPIMQNTGGRAIDSTSQPSRNIFPMPPHTIGGQTTHSVFPAPLVSQACGSSGVYPSSVGTRLSHSTVFPTLGSGGGMHQTIPARYYASGGGTPHLAVPMSPNLLHMSGKVFCFQGFVQAGI